MKKIRKLLIANRGEISIRIMRAATELGIKTVSIYAEEDKYSLHRFKADESYQVGSGKKPIAAYLDIEDIIRIAKETNVDAIHPGYGFLSENPDFAQACKKENIIFIGPKPDVMRKLGNKVKARNVAIMAGVPVIPATSALPSDLDECKEIASSIGYPLMLKASWGGGGRGMREINSSNELLDAIILAKSEALSAFGNDEVYLEKLIKNARHVEVQILGDKFNNLVHLFERDCTVQRRNQKVVERAPAPYLSEIQRVKLCEAALKLAKAVDYTHAGTVEFLMDIDTNEFYFIEVNPRIQVEHTVTEEVTGIDIVKAQIRISEGHKIGSLESFVPTQENIKIFGHAIQCRLTTEDPSNGFMPDYGRLSGFRNATGNGVRVDSGNAYTGAVITPFYDSLLAKVTVRGATSNEANSKMLRALQEFRIRGLANNLSFLENVVAHPQFISGNCTTKFIDQTQDLFEFKPKLDRATKLLNYLGNITVNGHPELKGRNITDLSSSTILLPNFSLSEKVQSGSRDIFKELGADKFSNWILDQKQTLITDTTMRDAHQSLFATRMRTYDMETIAPYYSQMLPDLFSIECWGGATFDVSMRFLQEDPWERLHRLREKIPNILFQMLLRSSNAVGYTNYPDNIVKYFISEAASSGIDLFRVFDSLNSVDNMIVAIDAVRSSGMICETAICYTSDINAQDRRYNLKYYVDMAKKLKNAGANILAIKDMAGICKPKAAQELVRALKEETGLPIHFHTHDTSGIASASIISAIDSGVDIVDLAMDSMSGLTSQPNLGSIIAAVQNTPKDTCLDLKNIKQISMYWEGVRRLYSPFESEMKAGTSDVYHHEMPGGQYTNLKEQARSLGIEDKWEEISNAYAEVNLLFGDIVKVTPTSKVVGDMALYMVSNGYSSEDILNDDLTIDFPDSVIALFKGDLGLPDEGFPAQLQKKVLKGIEPINNRLSLSLESKDLVQEKRKLEVSLGMEINSCQLASALMYPKVFYDFKKQLNEYGDLSKIPTLSFFYGLVENKPISINLEKGKTLEIKLMGRSNSRNGAVDLFVELNGQLRLVNVQESNGVTYTETNKKIDLSNPKHIGASMPGIISKINVKQGQTIQKGDTLFTLEAMKMELAVKAEIDGLISNIYLIEGQQVKNGDLIIELS